MHKLLLIIFLVSTIFTVVSAQSQRTEINGRQVEFNNDGTWYYIDEEDKMEEKADQEPIPEIISTSDKFNARQSSQQQRRANRSEQNKVNCSDIISVDLMPDFTGLQRQSEEVFVIGRNSIFMNWTYTKNEGYLFNIQFKKPRCISPTDKISFYFRDISENFTVSNIGTPNCEGHLKINDVKVATKLKSEKLKSISIRTKEGVFTENISNQNAMDIIESTNCIVKITQTN